MAEVIPFNDLVMIWATRIRAMKMQGGDFLPYSKLAKVLGVLTPSIPATGAEAEVKSRLDALEARWIPVQLELLEEDQMMFETVDGGVRMVVARWQIAAAERIGMIKMMDAITLAAEQVKHVATEELDDAARAAQADALGRLSRHRQSMLPSSQKKKPF